MNILFVCKWNCFRSKTAEAILKKLDVESRYTVKSAGIFPGHVTDDIIEAGSHLGLDLSAEPKGLSHDLAKWADTIIIVANDVPREIFEVFEKENELTLLKWSFHDVNGTTVSKREVLMKEIEAKIKEFIGELSLD